MLDLAMALRLGGVWVVLAALTSPAVAELLEYPAHQGEVRSLAYSPDGLLASAGEDKTVKLWNGPGKLRAVLAGNDGVVGGLAFSPDGKLLAGGDGKLVELGKTWRGSVCIWDVEAGKLARTIGDEKLPVTNVFFTPDGRRLAVKCGGQLFVWNLDDGSKELTFNVDQCVALSPDGKLLATARGKTVRVLDLCDGKERWRLSEKGDVVIADLAFDCDSKILASASSQFKNPGELRFLDAASGQLLASQPQWAFHVAFRPKSSTLISSQGVGFKDGSWNLVAWDAKKRKAIASSSPGLPTGTGTPNHSITALAVAPDGTAAYASRGAIYFWKAR